MKKIFFCTILSISYFFAASQSGVRIQTGINLANVTRSNGNIDDANMLSSFQAGLIGDIRLAPGLYFQPGLIYSGKGSKIQSGEPGTNGYFKQSFNPYYIEMPLSLVFKTPSTGLGQLFIGAGPYLAVGIRGKTRTEGQSLLGATYDVSSDLRFSDDDPTTLDEEEGAGFGRVKRFDYGLNGLVGLEGKSMVLTAGYGLGLAKIPSGSNNSSGDDNKHRVLSFTLGFKL